MILQNVCISEDWVLMCNYFTGGTHKHFVLEKTKHDLVYNFSIAGSKMRSTQHKHKQKTLCQEWKLLTCEETYSMQSSNFDSIGIKPSLFTDKVGEFSFCNDKANVRLEVSTKTIIIFKLLVFMIKNIFFSISFALSPQQWCVVCNFRPGGITHLFSIFQRCQVGRKINLISYSVNTFLENS